MLHDARPKGCGTSGWRRKNPNAMRLRMHACMRVMRSTLNPQETKMALEKAISAISDTNPAALASAVEASINAAVAASSSLDPVSATVAKVEAAVAKSLDGAALLSLASVSRMETVSGKPKGFVHGCVPMARDACTTG
jgi:hypothetical protein